MSTGLIAWVWGQNPDCQNDMKLRIQENLIRVGRDWVGDKEKD